MNKMFTGSRFHFIAHDGYVMSLVFISRAVKFQAGKGLYMLILDNFRETKWLIIIYFVISFFKIL